VADLVAALRARAGSPGLLLGRGSPERLSSEAIGADPVAAFRIASVTKTFVAAAVLRLVEKGGVSLSDPLTAVLPGDLCGLLPSPGSLTVDQLLTHTAGLPDYAMDEGYQHACLSDPGREWSREEQVAWAVSMPPLPHCPGEQVHYSDTGYVLLGALLEQHADDHLASAVRGLLGFGRLGLEDTWWELLEPSRPLPRVTQCLGGLDISTLHPSTDLWGGGGLVSTTADLTRFFQGLLAGEVLAPAALQLLLEETPLPGHPGSARGILRFDLAGEAWWGHGGFWGVVSAANSDGSRAFTLCVTDPATLDDGVLGDLLTTVVQGAA